MPNAEESITITHSRAWSELTIALPERLFVKYDAIWRLYVVREREMSGRGFFPLMADPAYPAAVHVLHLQSR